jgi:prepilin-type N-terminal cleavage/methylation domain-containing protein
MRARRGVTLLELLVAMTLFSLLSTAVFFSLRTGIGSLDRSREAFRALRRELGTERALERLLTGILRVDAAFLPPGASVPLAAPYFQGHTRVMRFVTANSLEEGARGMPRLAELAVLERPGRDGFRLIVNEYPYFGPHFAGSTILGRLPDPELGVPLLAFRPVTAGPRSYVLADRLTDARFAYLNARLGLPDVWLTRWTEERLPPVIRVELGAGRAVTSRVYAARLQ